MPSKDWADETEGTVVETKKPAAPTDGQSYVELHQKHIGNTSC